MDDLKLDILNSWSQSKLKILEKYANVYIKVVTTKVKLKPHYIDAFSGAGKVIIKETGRPAKGSPLIALQFNFASYYFIEKDKSRIASIEDYCREKHSDKNIFVMKEDCNEFNSKMSWRNAQHSNKNIFIIEGDCNKIIPKILSKMSWKNYDRVLCFLDPYGLHLQWNIIKTLAEAG